MSNTWLNISNASGTSTGTGITFSDSSISLTVSGTTTAVTGPENEIIIKKEIKEKGISAGLYFRFVKSRMQKIEVDNLKERVAPLRYLLRGAKTMEQQGLLEELEKRIVILFRYQEIAAAGFEKIVQGKYIHGFINSKLKDKTIEFMKLEKYPRPIPKSPQTKIKKAKDLKLFDELWILFNNPRKEVTKTTKEKIKEKDPIVFGRLLFDPDNYIFIADWVDEHCDLTLDKLIEAQGKDAAVKIEPLTVADMEELRETVMQRYKTLEETRSSNYKDKIVEQDKIDKERNKEKPRWWGWFKSYLKRAKGKPYG